MKDNNNKDAYWFSHDSNAKDDPKCVLLIDQLGLEGYGIYWVLVEILREQPDFSYPLSLVPAIAKRYGTSAPKVETVIRNFGLFEIREDKFFYSTSLISRVLAFKEKQNRRSAAALRANVERWRKVRETKQLGQGEESERNPNGIRTESERNPILSQEKKRKEKESNIGSSLHSEPCPTDGQSDAQSSHMFPETQTPVEKKAEVLSDKHCQQVVDFWNRKVAETGAQLPSVKSLSPERKAKIRIRWEEFSKVGNPVDVCRTLFVKATASKFLQGDNAKGWKANFDWLFTNGKNWVKVYEGNYDGTEVTVAAGGKKTRLDALRDEYGRIDEIFNMNQDNGKQQTYGIDEQ